MSQIVIAGVASPSSGLYDGEAIGSTLGRLKPRLSKLLGLR